MICPYCGTDLLLELEIWGHEWWPNFCCEQMSSEWQDHFETVGADEGAYALFQALTGGAFATRGLVEGLIDYKLTARVLTGGPDWQRAKVVLKHHRHHETPPVGWYFGAGVWNGPTLVGVATVGRAVARAYNGKGIVEVNRNCTIPLSGLERHAASKLYALCAREAKRRGYKKIITYTFVEESGVSLKAAGWEIEARIRGRRWGCRSRPRKDKIKIVDKHRSARRLTKP